MPRAAVYLRVSSDRTGEELGVTRQREDAEKLIAARGWELVDGFVDNDTSAAGKVRRPGFEAMIEAVEAGKLDAIVGWTLDRICRTARDRLRLLEAGKACNLVIALVRGSDMDLGTPSGRFAAGILGEVATHEIELKSERQKRASQQAAALGKPPVGATPFGFLPDRSHHPEQSTAIRWAYGAVLAGESLQSVAKTWNAAGLTSGRTRTGRNYTPGEPSQWRAETVRQVLINGRNAGLREYHGQILGPATWEPIVGEETWRAVRAILTDPARRTSPSTARHLLSGIARCGVCGEHMVAGATSTVKGYHAYRCHTRGHVARRGDHVDALIAGGSIEDMETVGLVVKRLRQPDAIDLLPRETGPDITKLRDDVRALRRRIEDVAIEFAEDDTVTPAQMRTATGRLQTRLAAAEAELAAAGRTSVLAPLVTADDARTVWEALSKDRRRAVIDALMTITLHPVGRGAKKFDLSTIRIDWKG